MHNTQLATIERLSRRIMLILALGFLAALMAAAQSGQSTDQYLQMAGQNLSLAIVHGFLVLAAAVHGAVGLHMAVKSVPGVQGMAVASFALASFWGLFATGMYGVVTIYYAAPN